MRGDRAAGRHLVVWDGLDDAGRNQPSGVYLARVDAKQLFFERYEGFQEYPEHLPAGLSEAQVRLPAPRCQ